MLILIIYDWKSCFTSHEFYSKPKKPLSSFHVLNSLFNVTWEVKKKLFPRKTSQNLLISFIKICFNQSLSSIDSRESLTFVKFGIKKILLPNRKN